MKFADRTQAEPILSSRGNHYSTRTMPSRVFRHNRERVRGRKVTHYGLIPDAICQILFESLSEKSAEPVNKRDHHENDDEECRHIPVLHEA